MIAAFRNLFLFFIFNILAALCSQGQENFRAVHWGLAEKMPVAPAFGMIKDVNGFMWVGTAGGGLVRFDGSLFKNYSHESSHKNAAMGVDIRGLIEDSLHNLWMGTENGLCLYDIKADTIRTVVLFTAKPSPENLFVPFWATKDEVFCWDYPGSQWAAFNIYTLKKRSLAKIAPADIGKFLADRFSIFDSASNSIWIEYGLPGLPGGGLQQVSLSTGKKLPYTWDCFRNIHNDDHSFQGMHYDRSRNAIWISCTDGLVEFTLEDKKFHHIAAMDALLAQKDYHLFAGINIDTLDRIWMGTFPKGIIIYDPEHQSLTVPFPKDSTQQQMISADNVMIYCDRDGMVWSGSFVNQSGIYQIIPFAPPVRQYMSKPGKSNSLSDDFAVYCLPAGLGKVWIGTLKGLNILDTKTDLFQVLRKNDLPGLKGEAHEIQPIAIDTSTQSAWLSVDRDKYYRMDMRSKQCTPIIFKDSNNQNLDKEDGFPRPFKNGSVLGFDYNGRTLVFIGNCDSTVTKQILSFPSGTINPFDIASDDDHFLFFRNGDSEISNRSFALVHGKWVLTHTPIDSIPWVNMIFNKADQSYWINAQNGLLHLSRDFRLIRTYTEKDGLPPGDRSWVVPDNYGNIWFTTDHSIHHLAVKAGRISELSEKDGFKANGFWIGMMFGKTPAGDLYIGNGINGKGFTRISPAKYVYTASTVYVQSLLINQQPYYFSPGIGNDPEIMLPYFENRFTITPGIIDLISAGKNQFRYKLGESAEWIYPINNIIYYDNLAPGNYNLIMQASNSDEFSGPVTTLHIHIAPPWWQTWWAYTLFAIAIISLLWLFIQYRSRALRAKNIQLEEKVLHRTKELKHSLEDLRETQNQLIQREKMASLGELTAGIAHEIQNPLNFVNNFSDVNMELLEEMKIEIKAGNPDEAIAIAESVIANQQKINHHGKRADAIVKGMLQHSRTKAGQKELTDINALADEYLRLSYQGFRAKDKTFNANLQTHFDPAVGSVNIVPEEIGRVLLNLCNNSFYAIHEKKMHEPEGYQPTVYLSTQKIESTVEIRLKDNGNGIPQKILDKIFQPFFTTKPAGEGTGLGLSLSFDIIKSHRGEIKVNTQPGEGAEFIIQLPA